MTLNYKNKENLYVIFFFEMTLDYKNEETLYVIFFLYVILFLICYILIFLNDRKLQNISFLSIRLKTLK